jgi:hypothetical protein
MPRRADKPMCLLSGSQSVTSRKYGTDGPSSGSDYRTIVVGVSHRLDGTHHERPARSTLSAAARRVAAGPGISALSDPP